MPVATPHRADLSLANLMMIGSAVVGGVGQLVAEQEQRLVVGLDGTGDQTREQKRLQDCDPEEEALMRWLAQ